ncbi:hypothetical protein AVEN_142038-1 [Araneus ventricosus]|uniref:Uncharacterized protein n=1 Tax=Araneus ventricosus TaxID=182803 RepID=A0A4Y2LRS0_ARAVE|nr:hypothetical protein AVEN_142038-1 [Araneus ventricosus]
MYHPRANPAEREKRYLKPGLAILVEDQHDSWCEKFPSIRFAINIAVCSSAGQTSAFQTFGRELRTVYEVQNDLRSVILKDTILPEITPYLKRFSKFMAEAKGVAKIQQDLRKEYGDRMQRRAPN